MTEDLVVFVTTRASDGKVIPLEGALVSIAQDGVITTDETDSEGHATFLLDAEDGPVIASASYPYHAAETFVGYDREVFRDILDADGALPFNLRPSRQSVIRVQGRLVRADPSLILTVLSNLTGWDSTAIQDEFVALALAEQPFTLTAFEQVPDAPPTPERGMDVPIVSWRTLQHAGSPVDITIASDVWVSHDLADHKLLVERPKTPAFMANDNAMATVSAFIASPSDPNTRLPVAAVSAIAPWWGREHFGLTITGRADAMFDTNLHVAATVFDDKRHTTVQSWNGLKSKITDRFLAPPEPSTTQIDIAGTLRWDAPDAENVWSYLIVENAETEAGWVVTMPPGISELDLPALLATLPSSGLGAGELDAALTVCVPEGPMMACTRNARGAPFKLASATATPEPRPRIASSQLAPEGERGDATWPAARGTY